MAKKIETRELPPILSARGLTEQRLIDEINEYKNVIKILKINKQDASEWEKRLVFYKSKLKQIQNINKPLKEMLDYNAPPKSNLVSKILFFVIALTLVLIGGCVVNYFELN